MQLRSGKNTKLVTLYDCTKYLNSIRDKIAVARDNPNPAKEYKLNTEMYEYINQHFIGLYIKLRQTTRSDDDDYDDDYDAALLYNCTRYVYKTFLKCVAKIQIVNIFLVDCLRNKNLLRKLSNVMLKTRELFSDFILYDMKHFAIPTVRRRIDDPLYYQDYKKYYQDYRQCESIIYRNFDYKGFTHKKNYESGLFADLYKNRLHPRNIVKFAGWGFEGFEMLDNA